MAKPQASLSGPPKEIVTLALEFLTAFTAKDGKIELIEIQPPPRESSIFEKQWHSALDACRIDRMIGQLTPNDSIRGIPGMPPRTTFNWPRNFNH
jgi:hypothetical protein